MIGEGKKGIFRRAVSAYAWSIAGDWREVNGNAKRLRARLAALRNFKYREESFDDAVNRLGLTKAELHRRHDQLLGLSAIYGLIVLVAIGFFCIAPYSTHPVNHALMSLGVIIVAGSKFLASRFRVAQIRSRWLFGFKEWLLGGIAK